MMKSPAASLNRYGKLWLNVASSHLVLNDFVNLDRSVWLTLAPTYPLVRHFLNSGHADAVKRMADARASGVLVTHDCRKPLPFPDGTADHILSSHFLEHLSAPLAEYVLSDYFRCLRSGGTLHVVLPDLRYQIDRYIAGDLDADGLVSATLLRSRGGR